MRRTTTILTCLAALSYATLQAQTPQDAPPETPLEAATQSETLQIVPTTTGLTVESLVHLALENNPTLAQARAETHKAYGRYVQAGLYPNPVVGYQSNEVFNGGKAGQQGLMYQQEFVRANKLELSQNVAAWSRQAAQQMLSAQEFRVANGTRQEFYAVLAARRVRELSRRLVQLTENVLTLARSRFEQAEGTRTEVLQATVERDRARLQLIAAENQLRAATRRLLSTVGTEQLDVEQLDGDLEHGLPELTWDTALQRIRTLSPELRRAQNDAKSAQAALVRAEVEPIPNLTVQVAPAYDFGTKDTILNLQATVPLPVYNQNEGNITSAHAEWIRACREVRRLELTLQRSLAGEFAKYRTSSEQLSQYRDNILPATEETLKLSRDAYRAGELGFLQILTIQRTYIETRQQYINTLGSVWNSAIAIDGLLLTNGLAAPTSSR